VRNVTVILNQPDVYTDGSSHNPQAVEEGQYDDQDWPNLTSYILHLINNFYIFSNGNVYTN
jgi:hypothetical protein